MCNPAIIPWIAANANVIMAGAAAAGAVAGGVQAKKEGDFKNDVAKFNARQLENEAVKTKNKGAEEELKVRQRTAQLLATQRAELGASNVDLGSGSALLLQEDTQTLGEVDALRTRSNFQDKASALEDKASLTLAEGRAAKSSGIRKLNRSLVTAVGSFFAGGVADKWFTSESAAVVGGGVSNPSSINEFAGGLA